MSHQKLFTMPRATPCHSFKYWKVEMRKWPINTILGLQEQETEHVVLATVRLRKESLKSHKSGKDTEKKVREKLWKKYQALKKSGKIKPSCRWGTCREQEANPQIRGTFCGNIPIQEQISPVTSSWLLGLCSVFNYSWHSLLISDEKWEWGGKAVAKQLWSDWCIQPSHLIWHFLMCRSTSRNPTREVLPVLAMYGNWNWLTPLWNSCHGYSAT